MWILSIEIIEENDTSYDRGTFLPPVVYEVRRCSRSVSGIVTSSILALVSPALCICGLSVGLPVFILGVVLLIAETIGFVQAKSIKGGFGLTLKRNAYLLAGALLTALAVFSKTSELYYEYLDLLEPLYSFASELPSPFHHIVGVGFTGEFVIFASLGVSFLAVGLSYGSLNRSRCKNLPFSKTVFFSVLVDLLTSAVLVCDGLARLHIIPSNYIYEDWAQSLVISRYCDAAICFGLGIAVGALAVRLLIVYIRMRKVKNAVL